MREILSKFLGFIKYILYFIALGLMIYSTLITYSRLEKSMVSAIFIFLPFMLLLLTFVIWLVFKSSDDKSSLLFNFVSVVVFTVIIIICLRAKLDTNMLLYYKYKINFNPTYFSDNLSFIEAMLYMLFISNVLLLLGKKYKNVEQPVKENQKKVEEIINSDDIEEL